MVITGMLNVINVKIYSVCHAESWAIYIIILCGLSMSTVHCFEYFNIIIRM